MKKIALTLTAALSLTGCGAATAGNPSKPSPTTPTPNAAKSAQDAYDKALDDVERALRKEASDTCGKLVKKNLKAPATAQWSGLKVRKRGETYVVTGSVDAENGFGALLRLDYRCTMKNGTVTLTKLDEPD